MSLSKKLDKMTWFIPEHAFPVEMRQIIGSGSEIAVYGYSHEGAQSTNKEQQRDVLLEYIKLATSFTGKEASGMESTIMPNQRKSVYNARGARFHLRLVMGKYLASLLLL